MAVIRLKYRAPMAGLVYTWQGTQYTYRDGRWFRIERGDWYKEDPPEEALTAWDFKESIQ